MGTLESVVILTTCLLIASVIIITIECKKIKDLKGNEEFLKRFYMEGRSEQKRLNECVLQLKEENRKLSIDFETSQKLVGILTDKNQRVLSELKSSRDYVCRLTDTNQMILGGLEELQKQVQDKTDEINKKEQHLKELLNSEDGFVGFSRMYNDLNGISTPSEIDDRANLYKYEYLLTIFPELKDYVKEYNPFYEKDLKERFSLKKIRPDEEQQTLDDFVANERKSKIAYGTAYEMYVGYYMRDQGWDVVQFGVKMGVNDLGRDLICTKNGVVYIIQCKNWSERKRIPERYICQLYGTAREYEYEHENFIVKPLFISSCSLTHEAEKFCEKLGVEFKILPFEHLPRIKCNISKTGEKIYHLPFDKQYDAVKIKDPGEMYAWTVEEARKAGFRRAYKKLV
jgi:hypothetical protein